MRVKHRLLMNTVQMLETKGQLHTTVTGLEQVFSRGRNNKVLLYCFNLFLLYFSISYFGQLLLLPPA